MTNPPSLPLTSWLQCTLCNNGLLAFAVRADTHHLYLECEECLSGYMTITARSVDDHFWPYEADRDDRPASHADILAAGLGWAIRQES